MSTTSAKVRDALAQDPAYGQGSRVRPGMNHVTPSCGTCSAEDHETPGSMSQLTRSATIIRLAAGGRGWTPERFGHYGQGDGHGRVLVFRLD
jgi:hypothetical protein